MKRLLSWLTPKNTVVIKPSTAIRARCHRMNTQEMKAKGMLTQGGRL